MKKLIIPIIAMLISVSAFAQPGGPKMRERIKAQKVAFITERIELTPKEAQKFWPIYNAYEEQLEPLRRNGFKAIIKALRDGTLSDSEAQKALDNHLNFEAKKLEAKRQLITDLKGVISPQKIIRLKIAEDAFNKKLLEELKKRREKRFNNAKN